MPVVASSAVGSVTAWATIPPERSTPKCSFFQPRVPRVPCCYGGPLAFADDRRSCAIDDEMHRALGRNAIECQIEMLTPMRERRVIRGLEVGAHQGQHGPQEALGLAQRPPEDQPQHQRGQDGHVRELPRSTRSTRRRRSPRIHRLGGEPQGHVAPPDERLLIFRPIPTVIFGLVLRMNLRLHPEIVGQERRPGQLIGDHDPRRVRAILHQRRADRAGVRGEAPT